MREIGPGDLLRQLLAAGAEFIATFQVAEAGGKAALGFEAIPPDVIAAFPGDTLTIRFDAHGTREAEVVDRDGVEHIEVWAAFYSTLGGERFLSIPVDRLVGLADVRNTPTPAPAATDTKAAPSARTARSQTSPMQPIPRHAGRPQAKLVEPPDDFDDTDPDADPSSEPPASPEPKKSRAERAGFRVIRGGAA